MLLTWHQHFADAEIDSIWDEVAKASPYATFFHTRTWANVLQASFPKWISTPIVVEFSDGNLMVIPLLRRQSLLPVIRYEESMLPGVYGGPLFLCPPEEKHWQIVWDVVNKFSNIIIYGNPFQSFLGHPRGEARPIFTQVLDLTRGFQKVWQDFHKGHKRNIKMARKKGIEIKLVTTHQEVVTYYKIYQNALERWGKQASGFYPKRLFENLFKHPEYGQSIKLWGSYLNQTLIGGVLMLYHNDHAVYWHGAIHSDYMAYRPAHFLMNTVIEDACDRKFRWFDFNPSGGLKGVEHFKNEFGAQRLNFFAYRRLSPLGKMFRLYRYFKERYFRICSL
jgi:hypothetical protein